MSASCRSLDITTDALTHPVCVCSREATRRWRCDRSAVCRDQAGCGRSELHHQTNAQQERLQRGESERRNRTTVNYSVLVLSQMSLFVNLSLFFKSAFCKTWTTRNNSVVILSKDLYVLCFLLKLACSPASLGRPVL